MVEGGKGSVDARVGLLVLLLLTEERLEGSQSETCAALSLDILVLSKRRLMRSNTSHGSRRSSVPAKWRIKWGAVHL